MMTEYFNLLAIGKHTFLRHSLLIITASTDKTVEKRAKAIWQVNMWCFQCINYKKVNIWNLVDGKNSENKNEQLCSVIYIYEVSKCHWNVAFNFIGLPGPWKKQHFLTCILL